MAGQMPSKRRTQTQKTCNEIRHMFGIGEQNKVVLIYMLNNAWTKTRKTTTTQPDRKDIPHRSRPSRNVN